MKVQIINGFKTILSDLGRLLLIESDKLQKYIDYAKDNGINRIAMNRFDGYHLDNVDFLKENNFFTGVTIGDEDINIAAVHYLKNLTYLSVIPGKQPVDFTKFPCLTECSIDWNNKISGLDLANSLKRLTIWKFKPKSKDLADLSGCKHLEYLHITESNIESWTGIEELKSLEYLKAYYLRKIDNLNGLDTLPHFKVLELGKCPNLKNYESDLKRLKHLEKIILSDSGDLLSLKFIKSHPKLKFISFVGTNVIDGDMTPTLELEYAGYDNKKHYSHKMKPLTRKV